MDFPAKKLTAEEIAENSRASPERREKLRRLISQGAVLTPDYMIMNVLATIVAT